MSVSDKITQLVNDISASYLKIEGKGGTIPTNKNTTNLPDAIDSIPSGGILPEKGLVFENYDSDGYPTTARFVGEWSGTLTRFPYYFEKFDTYFKNIESIDIPEGIEHIPQYGFFKCTSLKVITFPNTLKHIGSYAFQNNSSLISITLPESLNTFDYQSIFANCSNLLTVIFEGQCPNIVKFCFSSCDNINLYDFSNCTSVPTLYSAGSLGHASGCVIKVPSALLSEWQNATNWVDLTDVVWEGV